MTRVGRTNMQRVSDTRCMFPAGPVRRVLVTGSVGWSDRTLIEQLLDRLLSEAREAGGSFRLITGMAEGADLDARRWAGANGVPVLAEPLEVGAYPGPMHRYNELMLTWHPELVLAFKDGFDDDWASAGCVAGTEHMCRIAAESDIPVLLNGQVELAAGSIGGSRGDPVGGVDDIDETGAMAETKWGDTVVRCVVGDITRVEADVIVNAANSSLLGGGGVDGAIHRAAGPSLLEACRKVRAESGECATGAAVITAAGDLGADWVVHTVGPVWDEGRSAELDRLLAGCYGKSMGLAESAGAKSIAFPNISTGVYRYPKARAAELAVGAVRAAIEAGTTLAEVTFVCFDEENFSLCEAWLT